MSETYQGLSFLTDLLAQFILFSPRWRKKREKINLTSISELEEQVSNRRKETEVDKGR